MRRKLVKQGRNALTVTLPAAWTKKFGLKAGDEVDVSEIGKSIVLSNEGGIKVNQIEFDSTKLREFKNHYISYFYHKGFDEIKIIYDDPAVLTTTKNKLNELMGFEVVETGKNYFVIKNISEAIESEFDSILRRIFLMQKSMASDCFDSIKTKQYARLKDIRQMEKTNNKLTDFCIRILNKNGYKDYNKTTPLYAIVRELEKTGDIYKHICDCASGLPANFEMKSEVLNFFQEANNYLMLFYELFYKYNEKQVDEFFKKRDQLLKEGYSLLEKSENQEKIIIHHLINLVNQVFELKGPYFEMNLQ